MRAQVGEVESGLVDLLQATPYLRVAFDTAYDCIFIKDRGLKYARVNPAMATLFGRPADDFVGKTDADIFGTEKAAYTKRLETRVLDGEPIHSEFDARTEDRRLTLLVRETPLLDEEGQIIGLCGTARDITHRRQTDEAKSESEEQLQMLFEEAPDAHYLNDLKGNILDGNKAAERLSGYQKQELVGRGFMNLGLLPPAEIPRATKLLLRNAEGKATGPDEFTLIRKDGARVTAEIRTYPVKMGDRDVVLGIARDISESKRVSRQLYEAKQLLDCIVKNLPDMVSVKEARGLRYVIFNEAAEELTGYKKEELLGKTDYDLYTAEEADRRVSNDEAVLTSNLVADTPCELIETRSKETRYLRTKKIPLFDTKGRPNHLLSISEDITEQRESDRKIARLAAAIDQVTEGVVITGPDGIIQYLNLAFCLTTGFARADAEGQDVAFPIPIDSDDPQVPALREAVRQARAWSGLIETVRQDGSALVEEIFLSPMRSDQGTLTSFVATKRDVTTEAGLRQQLDRVHRMETLGSLTRGIVHDFNNILYGILGHANLALEKAPKDSPLKPYLEEVLRGGGRAVELVKQIRTLSQPTDGDRKPVSLQPIIKELLRLLCCSISPKIEIRTSIDPECGNARANATQVYQMIMNLCTNACQAMGDKGGTLRLELTPARIGEGQTFSCGDPKPGSYAKLSVSDTGPGMNETTIGRIFDPYFTTKNGNDCTGLGLSIVKSIIVEHEGAMSVESEPGKGTRFDLLLPIAS